MSDDTTVFENERGVVDDDAAGAARPPRGSARIPKVLDLPEVIYLPEMIYLSGPVGDDPAEHPDGTAAADLFGDPLTEAETSTNRKRSGSEKRVRSLVKFVRVTWAEREEMEQAARAEGLDVGTYTRQCALAEPERRRGDGPLTTTRSKSVPYRVSPEESDRIDAMADAAGVTSGSYVRLRALKRPMTLTTRRVSAEKAELSRLLALLGPASSNVEELARAKESGAGVPDGDARGAIAEIREAARAIIRSLGGRGE
jgi:uncharacterized protein (DUF1778 family)